MSVDADSRDGEQQDVDAPDTEEEKLEFEWHLWLLAFVLFAGVSLILFPPGFWPNVGFGLVAIAVVGWLIKEGIERTM